MKLLRFEKDGRKQYGVAEGETLYRLEGSALEGRPERGPALGLLEKFKPLPPCEPTKIICAGKNYPWGENPSRSPRPLLFFKPPSSVDRPRGEHLYPPESQRLIFESELVVVMGKPARTSAGRGFPVHSRLHLRERRDRLRFRPPRQRHLSRKKL